MQSIWHHAPMIRIVLPVIAGAAWALNVPLIATFLNVAMAVAIFSIVILILFRAYWKYYKYKYLFGAFVSLSLFAGGFLLTFQSELTKAQSMILPDSASRYFGQVDTAPELKERSIKFEIKLIAFQDSNDHWNKSEARILAYAPHEAALDTLTVGDKIAFGTHINGYSKPINPGQFDYGKYLQNHGISGTAYLYKGISALLQKKKNTTPKHWFKTVQDKCIDIFNSYDLRERELGVGTALILGERSLVLPDTRNSFADAGVIHILAVSGLHVGIIYIVILWGLNKLMPDKKYRWFKFIFTIAFLWVYAGVTGFSPSVLRATTMFSFIALGKQIGRSGNIYNMLAASALVLVIWHPAIIKEVGFQLSYCAVLGIAYFYPPIYSKLIFKPWVLDKTWALLVVSISAQIATFPLSLYYFGQFPNLFMFSNLVVIPVATLALYTGLSLLVLNWVPYFDQVLAFLFKWELWLLNEFIDFVAAVPHSVSRNISFGITAVVLSYIFLLCAARALRNPRGVNLWWALISLTVLISLRAHRNIANARSVEIAILQGQQSAIISCRSGNRTYLLTSDTSTMVDNSNKFFLQGYYRNQGISYREWLNLGHTYLSDDLVIEKNYLQFHGKTVILLNENQSSMEEMAFADVILLGKDVKKIPAMDIPFNKIIVFDPAIPYYRKEKQIASFIESGQLYWDMSQSGAYIVQINPP